jgi:predicted AlkP superfamily pyrophosphatase or phosphodiesterase
MKKTIRSIAWVALIVFATAVNTSSGQVDTSTSRATTKPKWVVVLMVDGLPMEQLRKNRDLFVANGFRRFTDSGAMFADAHQAHAFTLTAPGNAAVVSGSYPCQNGIIGSEWHARDGQVRLQHFRTNARGDFRNAVSKCERGQRASRD